MVIWLFTIAITLASSIAQHSHHLMYKDGGTKLYTSESHMSLMMKLVCKPWFENLIYLYIR